MKSSAIFLFAVALAFTAAAYGQQHLLADSETRYVLITYVAGDRSSFGNHYWGHAWISVDRKLWYQMDFTSDDCRPAASQSVNSYFRAEWMAKKKELRLHTREIGSDKPKHCNLKVSINQRETRTIRNGKLAPPN